MLPEIQPLLAADRLMGLGPGTPNLAVKPALLRLEQSLPAKARDRGAAQACMAGLWLLHDFFDESHSISQDLATAEGSYWHGILHRREPDYWNAKYWFRRAPTHAIHAHLHEAAISLVKDARSPVGCDFLLTQKKWSPSAFVDLCEMAARGDETLVLLCRRIQQREWELLFRYCREQAF